MVTKMVESSASATSVDEIVRDHSHRPSVATFIRALIAELVTSQTRNAQNEASSRRQENPRIVSYACWSCQKPADGRWIAAWMASAASRLQLQAVQNTH